MKLEKIIELNNALNLIESNSKLDFKISYRLGRIQDKCKSIIRVFELTQNKMRDNYQKMIAEDSEKSKELQEEYVKKITELLEVDEKIEIPKFQLTDFENKDIPLKFFTAFSEHIEE